MSEWPTESVELDHLEAMGLLMALYGEQQRSGLSSPQVSAREKLEAVSASLLRGLGRDGHR